MGGQVVGEYHRVSAFTFDDQGNRYEKINFFPMPTFPGMTMSGSYVTWRHRTIRNFIVLHARR